MSANGTGSEGGPEGPTRVEDDALPAGWISAQDPRTGKVYYIHLESERVSWKRPTGVEPMAQAVKGPGGGAAEEAEDVGTPDSEEVPPSSAVNASVDMEASPAGYTTFEHTQWTPVCGCACWKYNCGGHRGVPGLLALIFLVGACAVLGAWLSLVLSLEAYKPGTCDILTCSLSNSATTKSQTRATADVLLMKNVGDTALFKGTVCDPDCSSYSRADKSTFCAEHPPGTNQTCYWDPSDGHTVVFDKTFTYWPVFAVVPLFGLFLVMVHWLCFIRVNAAKLGKLKDNPEQAAAEALHDMQSMVVVASPIQNAGAGTVRRREV